MSDQHTGNREEILARRELDARADLAELGAQGKTIGGGFAEGAVERQKVLSEAGLKPYEGVAGNVKFTNYVLLGVLAIIALLLISSIFSRI